MERCVPRCWNGSNFEPNGPILTPYPHNKVIGNKWETYLALLQTEYDEGYAFLPVFFFRFVVGGMTEKTR